MKYKITYREVLVAYYEARKHKRFTESQIIFELDLFKNLYELWEELRDGNYTLSLSNCFMVTRPKLREVFAADFRDRIVHHILINRLMSHFQELFIENSFSCMPSRGTLYGVRKLKEAMDRHPEGYVFKFDLKGFFMSIDKKLLCKKLLKYIDQVIGEVDKDEAEFLKYITRIIVLHCPEKNCIIKGNKILWKNLPAHKSLFTVKSGLGLAIGNLTSQLFAGFYLDCFDKFMYSIFGDDYGRYVDDFYIVSENKEKVLHLIPKMEKFLKNHLKLTLHKDKRYIQPVRHGCKFIGSVVKEGRIYVGNGTVSNMTNTGRKINKYLSPNKVENIAYVHKCLNSYLGFLSYCNAFDIMLKMIKKISNSWLQYFDIEELEVTKEEKRNGKCNKVALRFKDKYKILNKL